MPIAVNTNASSIVGYNRIEPRTSVQNFDLSLSNPVFDPLWLLTQQWRAGEFNAHDGGTAILSKIETESFKLNRLSGPNGPADAYNTAQIPLEAAVEAMPFKFELIHRLQMGRHWLKLLRQQGLGVGYDALFSNQFPIDTPGDPESLSNETAIQVRHLATNRLPDGAEIYTYFLTNNASGISGISPGDISAIDAAALSFKQWFERTYYVPHSAVNKWSPSQLSYQFNTSAPLSVSPSAQQTVLTGKNYNGQSLDWYSSDVSNVPNATLTETPSEPSLNTNAITSSVSTYIPHLAMFNGMPRRRWWQFEDRNHDIGQIVNRKNDLLQMIVTDFGLTYSNDWFVIPHQVEAGTLTKIKGLVITDSFGRQTVVNKAGTATSQVWQVWNLFALNQHGAMTNYGDERLFLPPSLPQAPDFAELEKVVMLRDEMSNLVWGVEELVSDELGRAYSGREASNNLLNYMQQLPLQTFPIPSGSYIGNEATIRYKLSNSVPENWIPFIPAKTGNTNRVVAYQRASMHRYFEETQTTNLVRPRTGILRVGLDQLTPAPYFINEEEISRSGVSVSSGFQRTRWYNGKVITWFGYQRSTGNGEGSSGLKFDFLSEKKTDTSDSTNFVVQENTSRILLEDNTGYITQ
jgi:hypothetical protein